MKKKRLAEAALRNAAFNHAEKELGKYIKKSKVLGWQNFKDEVNKDPWCLAYKIVTRKFGNLTSVGSDSIPVKAVKAIVHVTSEIMLNMYNSCLKMAAFPN